MSKSLLRKILDYFDPSELPVAEVVEITIPAIEETYREPVQSLVDSIKQGYWERITESKPYVNWSGNSLTFTFTVGHIELNIEMKINVFNQRFYSSLSGEDAERKCVYMPIGESWLNDKENEAVGDAFAEYFKLLDNEFKDSHTKQREQEFMKLITKES